MIHSLPAEAAPGPCSTAVRRPHPALREFVVAYSGFEATAPLTHRLLPMNFPALIVDITGAGWAVTAPRTTPVVEREVRWGRGVLVALTPAGAGALLGLPLRDLTLASSSLALPAASPLHGCYPELAERLTATAGWAARFAVLENWLAARLRPGPQDALITEAWWRLQRGGARAGTVAADLGVSRRRLETGFQRWIGLPPGSVARIARFQRAVRMLTTGTELHRAAADSGYADQPHFTREVHAMAGLTPTAFREAVQAALGPPLSRVS